MVNEGAVGTPCPQERVLSWGRAHMYKRQGDVCHFCGVENVVTIFCADYDLLVNVDRVETLIAMVLMLENLAS